jgi:CBS domain-containing protein
MRVRKKLFRFKTMQVIDPVMICIVGGLIAFYLPIIADEKCERLITGVEHMELQRYNCRSDQYSPLSSLLFNTEGNTVKGMMKYGKIWGPSTNIIFMCFWIVMTAVTYGSMIPAGLFIPSILIGCSMGNLVGSLLKSFEIISIYESQTYAIIGSATVIAGITRCTFSLAVLMMETAQDVNLFIPMMMAVMIANSVGNLFSTGIYHNGCISKNIPLISPKLSLRAKHYECHELMSVPVHYFRKTDSIGKIFNTLYQTKHNGFPVVTSKGKVVGLISRNHLVMIIKNRWFVEERVESLDRGDPFDQQRTGDEGGVGGSPETDHFDPRRRSIISTRGASLEEIRQCDVDWTKFEESFKSENLPLSEIAAICQQSPHERVDLAKYMQDEPFVVTTETSAYHAIFIFHQNSLRHLPVVHEENNQIAGIISRENIVAFLTQENMIKNYF